MAVLPLRPSPGEARPPHRSVASVVYGEWPSGYGKGQETASLVLRAALTRCSWSHVAFSVSSELFGDKGHGQARVCSVTPPSRTVSL